MTPAGDTIFALSSGQPPAAIAVVRISGPAAGTTLAALARQMPEPRRASLATLHSPESGEPLDRALLLWFPGPGTATGEDLCELHLHGGRSVVAAVLGALGGLSGLRPAEPGEFTRRAFENGRIDLSEAEGLADLLAAETQSQRRAALALAGGALSRMIGGWQQRLLALSASLEAAIDFSDEGEVGEELPSGFGTDVANLAAEMRQLIGRPPVERLRDGIRVSIAGPPNAGKSSIFNELIGRPAAITSAIPGTTRDLVEAPTAIGGTPFLFTDTAGLRDSDDAIEAIGVERARNSLAAADIILWLGEPHETPDPSRSILVHSKADLAPPANAVDVQVSVVTGQGMDRLTELLLRRAGDLLPQEGEVAINRRHAANIANCLANLEEAENSDDLLVAAEALRDARQQLDQITGRSGVEQMLDSLFGRFCIGK